MKRTNCNSHFGKWMAAICAACALFTMSATASQTKVLKFDNSPGSEEAVPNGYGTLNWTNFAIINGVTYDNSGYQAGVISTNNVAFNNDSAIAKIKAKRGRFFRLNSGHFTAAWNDGLQLEVVGRKNGQVVYDNIYVLNATNSMFITFPRDVITEADFSSSGGAQHVDYLPGSGEHFAVDNLSVTVQ